MTQMFRQIDPDVEKIAYREAYSIESKDPFLSVQYLGSRILYGSKGKDSDIYDYYKDENGGYWYGTRVLLENGKIVKTREYILLYSRRKDTKICT